MVNKLMSSEASDANNTPRYPKKAGDRAASATGNKREPSLYGQRAPVGKYRRPPGSDLQAKPWRQWHTATNPGAPAALEVAKPKKPQWGRWIYFAILLAVAFIAVRFVYLNFFWYSADGFISGKQYNVSPSDTVSIQEIFVTPSDAVEEGQLLVKLSSPTLVQSLAKNEAEIARLQSDLAQRSITSNGNESQLLAERDSLQAEMEYLESLYFQETQQLNALQDLVAAGATQRGNLDQLRSQHNKTWADYKRVEAELKSTRQQLSTIRSTQNQQGAPELSERLMALKELHQSIEDQLAALELRAPATGTVSKVPVSKGDVLRAGETAVEIVDKNKLRAYLYFPPAAQSKLHEGMTLPVSRADGTELELVVDKVYPSMDSLPNQFQRDYRPGSAAIVVEASPVDGQAFEMQMTSGTPIQGLIPRWSFLPDFGKPELGTPELDSAEQVGEAKTDDEAEAIDGTAVGAERQEESAKEAVALAEEQPASP